jgi:hypothetical protein
MHGDQLIEATSVLELSAEKKPLRESFHEARWLVQYTKVQDEIHRNLGETRRLPQTVESF